MGCFVVKAVAVAVDVGGFGCGCWRSAKRYGCMPPWGPVQQLVHQGGSACGVGGGANGEEGRRLGG